MSFVEADRIDPIDGCVLFVGDSGVGKSAMLCTYSNNGCEWTRKEGFEKTIPTVFAGWHCVLQLRDGDNIPIPLYPIDTVECIRIQ